jgi:hypothetical protein
MSFQMLLPIILIAVFGAYSVYMMQKRKQAMSNLGPALRNFFERTGYRYAEAPKADLEPTVQLAEEKIRQQQSGRAGGFETHMVRDYHGMKIEHQQFMGNTQRDGNNVYVMSCDWRLVAAEPPAVKWQAAARSLSGAGKALKEAFSNSTREWSALYPEKVESGDPELDKKLNFYGEDPEAVRRVLATPGLKEAMLACEELDLRVSEKGVVFVDPTQKNLRAGLGGTVGMMATGFDYGKLMDLSIPVHDRIAELLALAARASR